MSKLTFLKNSMILKSLKVQAHRVDSQTLLHGPKRRPPAVKCWEHRFRR